LPPPPSALARRTLASSCGRHEASKKPLNDACSGCHKVGAERGFLKVHARCYDGLVATLEEPTTVITLTERAAAKIKELQADEPEGDAGVLRVAVQGGGCSGFEYALGFDRGPLEGDHVLEAFGVRVVVDPFSAPYLQGASIDFLDGLQESGFKIENPNAVASCGCGHSFQVADEDAPEGSGAGGCGSGCSH
jgi:iron-sulfur cluster assembly protein